MARPEPPNAEQVTLSPEDMGIADLFVLRRSFNKDGSINYVQVIGDEALLDAFALGQPVRFAEKGTQKLLSLPRLIMQRMLKRPLLPEELVIPENGKKGDCRRSNLKLSNRSELASNTRTGTWSESGEKYVYPAKNGRYYANFAGVYLGSYDSPEEAAAAIVGYQDMLTIGVNPDEAAHRIKARSRNSSRIKIQR